jgi:hypothetical protein
VQVLDGQGRLFGRINIVDAAVVVVVCLLIPLGYSSYLLFRTPPTRIVSIEPSRITFPLLSVTPMQVRVRGENLRPFFRAVIGTQAVPLLFENLETIVLRVPPFVPGSYDVVLYDQDQELDRMADALVVYEPAGALVVDEPAAPPEDPPGDPAVSPEDARTEAMVVPSGNLLAIGRFRRLNATVAQALSQNLQTLEQGAYPWGHVAGFRPPEPDLEYVANRSPVAANNTYQIGAVLQFRCTFAPGQCLIPAADQGLRDDNVAVLPGATVPINIQGVTADFVVAEVHAAYTGTVELVVQGDMTREIASVVVDLQRIAPEEFPARDALRPAFVSVDFVGEPSDANLVAKMRLRVPILKVADAWWHQDHLLRLGGQFRFERPFLTFGGQIISIRSMDGTQETVGR